MAAHEPTEITRELVKVHSTVGTPQEVIADIIGITAKTLRAHYRRELDLAAAECNATIAECLYQKAKKGDTTAMIFWLKTRARWRESTTLNHTSEDGTFTPKDIPLSAVKELAAALRGD